MVRVAGTCVAVDGLAALLRGPSGVGKSDLALRLIEEGARLVADDFTELLADAGRLMASAPPTIRGMLEVRGLGILRFEPVPAAPLVVVVDLVPASEVPRMPDPETTPLLDFAIPLFRLAAVDASCPAKVRLAIRLATGGIMEIR
jgi:serine kinase of HPr protein (carbohydrate metabolism regulator)